MRDGPAGWRKGGQRNAHAPCRRVCATVGVVCVHVVACGGGPAGALRSVLGPAAGVLRVGEPRAPEATRAQLACVRDLLTRTFYTLSDAGCVGSLTGLVGRGGGGREVVHPHAHPNARLLDVLEAVCAAVPRAGRWVRWLVDGAGMGEGGRAGAPNRMHTPTHGCWMCSKLCVQPCPAPCGSPLAVCVPPVFVCVSMCVCARARACVP
jgi:hypothetical protein